MAGRSVSLKRNEERKMKNVIAVLSLIMVFIGCSGSPTGPDKDSISPLVKSGTYISERGDVVLKITYPDYSMQYFYSATSHRIDIKESFLINGSMDSLNLKDGNNGKDTVFYCSIKEYYRTLPDETRMKQDVNSFNSSIFSESAIKSRINVSGEYPATDTTVTIAGIKVFLQKN